MQQCNSFNSSSYSYENVDGIPVLVIHANADGIPDSSTYIYSDPFPQDTVNCILA